MCIIVNRKSVSDHYHERGGEGEEASDVWISVHEML